MQPTAFAMSLPGEPAHGDLLAEAHDWTAWPELVPVWSALATAAPHASVFLTPEAVDVWLGVFGPLLQPSIVLIRDAARTVVGAAILVRRTIRKGPFAIRRVYVNTAGEDDADSACLEFNHLVCRSGAASRVARAVRSHLDREPWDELIAPGLLSGESLDGLGAAFGDAYVRPRSVPNYYVALDELRGSGKRFVELLAPRERTRYRQNLRKYAAYGELVLDAATTTAEAIAFLGELAQLHQVTWIARGATGAFASRPFCDYHKQLVERCFPLGWIELLRLRAGSTTIGYHYNFVFKQRLYFYQSGYNYGLGDKTAPGMVLHTFAIERANERGFVDYDFMAGNAEYKRRLATRSRPMHWMTWHAPSLKMRGYQLIRGIRNALAARSQSAARTG